MNTESRQIIAAGLLVAYRLGLPLTIAGKLVHVPGDLGSALFPDESDATQDTSDLPPGFIRNLARRCAFYIDRAGEEITSLGLELGTIGGALRCASEPAGPSTKSERTVG